ncbi:MAG TPA: phosphate ABC transporter permease subunit PstC [Dehalococcoidales bacterium]|nr:phosphate ABC transporter permease subunit PstC [Dehalococcoidales bacterium]
MQPRGVSSTTADAGLTRSFRRRWRFREKAIEGFIFGNGLLAVIILLGVLFLLMREGLPAFAYTSPFKFLFGTRWYPVSEPPTFGMLTFFVATLWVTLISTAIAVPIGVLCAAYLAEIAPASIRETVKPIIELLAGIPSVVMGLIGLLLLSPLVQSVFNLNTGLCGLTAAIMLSMMSLPIIVSVSEDALRAVPKEFREASYALGATKWETIRHVCIPGALSGIAAATMLGVGRAIGETMTVLMVAGGALAVPYSPTEPMMPITAAIASGIGNAVRGGPQYQALFAIGLILFFMTLSVNLVADRVLERQKRKFAR